MQAYEYETDQDRTGALEAFFKSTEGQFTHPKVKQWVEELYKQRNVAFQRGSDTTGSLVQ